MHVSHYQHLTKGARVGLSMLVRVIELTGLMPSGVQHIHVPLLEKPQGGYRPIGLFPSLYRVYMKLRQPAFMQWEKEHDRPFFAQGKGPGWIGWAGLGWAGLGCAGLRGTQNWTGGEWQPA